MAQSQFELPKRITFSEAQYPTNEYGIATVFVPSGKEFVSVASKSDWVGVTPITNYDSDSGKVGVIVWSRSTGTPVAGYTLTLRTCWYG